MDLLNRFQSFLLSSPARVSPVTIKNYRADIGQFIKWFEGKYHESFNPNEVSPTSIELYRAELGQSLSQASVDRHISSLRKFLHFLKIEGIASKDPFEEIKIASSEALAEEDPFRLKDFKNNLYVYNASKLTIKNYLIDVRQFLAWASEVTGINDNFDKSEQNIFSLINGGLVEEYKRRLIQEGKFSPASVNRKLSSLRKYFSWATQEGLMPTSMPEFEQLEVKKASTVGELSYQNQPAKTNNKSGYSSFPPVRLLQKISKPFIGILDLALISTLAGLFTRAELWLWSLKGKPIFKGKGKSFFPHILSARDPLLPTHVKNIKKEFFAPALISTRHLPFHRKILFHARYTRPNWYKKYHSYPLTSYFHLAILLIFMSAIGFAFYNSFFNNPNTKSTFAAAVAPPRILSFQGRLTDNSDNPITSVTNLRMAIYSDPSASGGALLWQEIETVAPDSDGIFSLLMGNDTVIPSTVFTDNATLYLGVTVGTTPELTPRQRLATVAYASNSESLQGMIPITAFPAGTHKTSTILALDSSGNLTIGGNVADTPIFQATDGQFTLSGKVLNLTTVAGTNTNIQLVPDGTGKIDLQKPLQNSTLNNNVLSAAGSVEVDDIFSILATSSGQSALTINNDAGGPLISASASGVAKFTVGNNGTITDAAYTSQNGVLYGTQTTGVIAQATTASSGLCLVSGASNPTWTSCSTASNNYWQLANMALSPADPYNSMADLLLGAASSSSARFAVLNINPNATNSNPIASVSATGATNRPGIYISGDGSIQAVNNGTLTVGGTTTGNILLNPQSGKKVQFFSSSNTIDGSGNITLAGNVSLTGTNPSIGSTSTNRLDLTANSTTLSVGGATASVGIGTTAPLSNLDVRGSLTQGFTPVASFSGTTGKAVGVFDQSGTGDILTASSAGKPLFTILGNGNISLGGNTPVIDTTGGGLNIGTSLAGTITVGRSGQGITLPGFTTNNNTVLSTNGSGTLSQVTTTTAGQCLVSQASGNFPQWTTCPGGTGGGYWTNLNGTIYPSDLTNDLLIGGNSTASATFHVYGTKEVATNPVATISANTNFSALVIDQKGNGDILTASSAGKPLFTILGNGNISLGGNSPSIDTIGTNGLNIGNGSTTGTITLGRASAGITLPGFTAQNGVLYGTQTTGVLAQATTASTGLCLVSGASNPTWTSCSTASSNYWQLTNMALSPADPYNSVADLLIGASATTSAKFAVLNIANGIPVASVSSGLNGAGAYLTADGKLGTTKKQTLQLGDTNTGNINFFSSSNILTSSGNLTLAGNVSLTGTNPSIGSTSTNRLDLTANSTTLSVGGATASVGIGTTAPLANLDIRGSLTQGFTPVASASGTTGKAVLVIDQSGTGDLFTASSAGKPLFTILNNGNLSLGGNSPSINTIGTNGLNIGTGSTTGTITLGRSGAGITLPAFTGNNAALYSTVTTGVLASATTGTANLCLVSGAGGTNTPGWASCAASGSVWTQDTTNLVLYPSQPYTSVTDLLVGGSSTASAKFSVLNIAAGGVPSASVSSGLNGAGAYLTADGKLGTTNKQTLQLGDTNTGNINFFSSSNTLASNGNLTLAGSTQTFTAANTVITGSTGLTLQETGDTYGTVKLSLQNRNGVNGALFDASLSTVDLVDFVFKGQSNQRNIRYEDRSSAKFVAAPEFEIGSPADPTLIISDNLTSVRKGTFTIGQPSSVGGTITTNSTLDVRGTSGTLSVASISGRTAIASLVSNNDGVGALFTASASSQTRFVITNSGKVGINTGSNNNNLLASLDVRGIDNSLPAGYFRTTTNGTGTIAATSLTTGHNAFSSTSDNTASISPLPNSLILLAISSGDTTSAPTSVTGNGLTWVQVGSTVSYHDGTDWAVTLWRAMGINPTSGQVTINWPASIGHKTWNIVQVTGVDTTGTNGSGAIVQNASNSSTAAGQTSLTVTLNSFQDSTNNAAFGFFHTVNTINPGSGFSEINEENGTSFWGTYNETEYKIGQDTSVDASFSSANSSAGIAVELKAAPPIPVLALDNEGSGDLFLASTANLTKFLITNAGSVGIGTTSPLGTLDVRGISGTLSVASVSAATSFASLVINNDGVGDVFTASSSSIPVFTITASGGIALGGTKNVGLSTQCITGGSIASWGSCGASTWTQESTPTTLALYPAGPYTSVTDVLIGGTSTASADFAFTNVANGTPTFIAKAGIVQASKFSDYDNTAYYLDPSATNFTANNASLYLGAGVGINTGGSTNTLLASSLDVRGLTVAGAGTISVASISGQTSFAGLVVDNQGAGDLFTASSAGKTHFVITGAGVAQARKFADFDNTTYFVDPSGTGVGGNYGAKILGTVAIGTNIGSITEKTGLYINTDSNINGTLIINNQASANDGDLIDASASGTTNFRVKNNGDTVVGNGGGGKLTAGTLDPLYTIDGNKYSTYAPSMIGVKEEMSGRVNLTYDPTLQAYAHTININGNSIGSDLWLFSRVTSPDINLTDVLLTADSNSKVWYKKDPTTRSIIFFSDRPTGISYRLTAARFDHSKWGNVSDEQDPLITGLVAPAAGNSIIGEQLGDSIQNAVITGNTDSFSINKPAGQDTYFLVDGYNNIIKKIDSFSSIIAANIQAGQIKASSIIADSLSLTGDSVSIAGQSLANYITSIVNSTLNQRGITSDNTIAANIISPLSDNLTVQLKSNDSTSKLVVKNASGSAVASIDGGGNASLSGNLNVGQNATVSGSLTASNASISGTLRASRIIADEILGLNSASASSIINNYYISTSSASSSTSAYLADLYATDSGTLKIPSFTAQLANINNINGATATFTQGLMSFGPSSFYDVSVAGQFSVGAQLTLADHSINVLGSDLQIQPLKQGGVDFLAGAVKIDVDGNLMVNGNANFAKDVSIQGVLSANILSPIAGNDLTLRLGSGQASNSALQNLSVKNASNSSVFTITQAGNFIASGAGTFNKLNLSIESKALAVSLTEVIATGSAGIATISAHKSEITIDNPLVTDKSLIYITPRSDPGNNSLFLMRQVAGKSFTIGTGGNSNINIPFNWIIVN